MNQRTRKKSQIDNLNITYRIYRNLGQVIEDAINPETGQSAIGNPGKGDLSFLPQLTREYKALELTFERMHGSGLRFFTSYVLSKNEGNYPGLHDSDLRIPNPNLSASIELQEQLENATGLLPNDRTHVFKIFGSYKLDFGLNVGANFVFQSGTPLSEFGGSSFGPPLYTFIRQRGTAGRTANLWDLNIRLTYNLSRIRRSFLSSRLILDFLHVGSPREAVLVDQIHFFALDENGNQTGENPSYGEPSAFQAPMTLRLGLEFSL